MTASWSKVGNLRGAQFATSIQSASTGLFSGSFPAGCFSAPPIVAPAAVASSGRDYVVTMTSVTASTFSGQVRMSQKLPAVISLLSALAGYDTFAAPGAPVTVHITANAATS